MDIDFSSLAARIASDVHDLRGCVIVSRDGLVLGSHPADAENLLRPAWLRFASLGDVEKGFIQFTGELWVYVRRGPYASFAVSNSVSRPGLLLDELEQVLMTAEEARTTGTSAGLGGGGLPGSRPRTSLHPEPRSTPAHVSPTHAEDAESDASFAELSAMSQSENVAEARGEDTTVVIGEATPSVPAAPTQDLYSQYSPSKGAVPTSAPAGQPAAEGGPSEPEESREVDRVALSQEFAQLLGDSGYDAAEED